MKNSGSVPNLLKPENDSDSLNLSFEEAQKDSPLFRANLQHIEDEVEKLAVWLEGVCKTLKAFVDEVMRYSECSKQLSSRCMPTERQSCELLDADLSLPSLRTFSDALQCVHSFQDKMIDDVNEYLLSPLLLFSKEDIKDMRETRRYHERIVERYDNALQRFCALSKTKEASSLREDAFQLYDVRKVYVKSSMDYTAKAQRFKLNLDRLVSTQFTEAINSVMEFHQNAAELYKGLKPRFDELKEKLGDRKNEWETELEALEADKMELQQEVLEKHKPSSALPLQAPSSTTRPVINIQTPPNIEGYLLKRAAVKSSIIVPIWNRRWCFIKDCKFGYIALTRQRGVVAASTPISVLLCEVKADDKQERRYCFEVLSSKSSSVFQAETQEEYIKWLQVFEASKREALKRSLDKMDVLDQESPGNESRFSAEDEEWESVSTPPLIQKRTASSASRFKDTAILEKPRPNKLVYPDVSYERRNAELHAVIPSVPSDDYVIDSFPSALQNDVSVQGRVYLTQNRLCFYSNLLNAVNTLVLPFTEIITIEKSGADLKNAIVVSTSDTQFTFKSFFRDDGKTLGVMKSLLQNAQSRSLLPLQDLFESIHQTHKQSESSGKESQHLTVSAKKDGRRSHPTTRKSVDMGKKTDGKTSEKKSETETWPPTLPVPQGELKCECSDHNEKIEIDTIIGVSAKKLFEMLFGTPDFFVDIHTKRKDWDVVVEQWNNDTNPTRTVKWMFTVNNPMTKVKETDCTEVQKLIKKEEHLRYVIDCNSRTPNIPYGDSFQTASRFCITFATKDSCRVLISIGVKFSKNPLVKSIIKSAAMKGIQDYLKDWVQFALQRLSAASPGSPLSISVPALPLDTTTDAPMPISTSAVQIQRKSPSNLWSFVFLVLLSLSFTMNIYFYRAHYVPSLEMDIRNGGIKGVFIKDIEDSVINSTTVMKTRSRDLYRRDSFALFLKGIYNHPWFNHKFSLKARELNKVTKQVHFLRRNLLESFVYLNDFEQIILESEYVNWLSDQIIGCWSNEKRLSSLLKQTSKMGEANNFERLDEEKRLKELGNACMELESDLNSFIQQQTR